jgi:hypothetical protein
LTDEVKDQLKPKGRAFKRQLESIPFPEKVKDMMRALTSNGNQTTALHLQDFFEEEVLSINAEEDVYRDLASGAMKEGDQTLADEIVLYYVEKKL